MLVSSHIQLNRKHEMFLNDTLEKNGKKVANLTVNMKCF